MNKWIRWKGLIAFVAVALLLAVFWLFFIDKIVRRTVERTGTAIAGAEVDVAGARVTLSPLGITLSGIQITDPEHPSKNSVEMGRVAFSLDTPGLLRRKVIIHELTAGGLRFGTARKKPGFVAKREKKKLPEKKPFTVPLPSFRTPDVKDILAKEHVEAPKVIDDARASIRRTKEEWQKRIGELPDKAAIDAYRRRLDKLKASSLSSLQGIASAAGDAKKLADDINADLERVRKARAALNTDLTQARTLAKKAEQAPLNDVRRIADKYSLSPSGLRNMSRTLFGAKIVSWFDTGLVWYDRIAPLLSVAVSKKENLRVEKPVREKGVDVKFPERHPLPDFLIRTARLSLQPDAGSFSGTIRNITRDQYLIGAPLTFQFDGSDMRDLRAVSLTGSLDHIHPAAINDRILIRADGYRAGDMILSEARDLPITLRDGLMNLEVTGHRDKDGLRATLVAAFKSVRIETGGGEGGGMIMASLRGALSRVTAFSLTADIAGTPGSYDVKVSSDLDRVFRDAVGRMVQEQRGRLEQQLKTAVLEKTGGKLQDLKAGLAGLNGLGGDIDSVQNRLEALLTETRQKAGGKVKLPF